jgi:hypothetical protein
MLNNFILNWLIFIFIIISGNLIIRLYKYFVYRYLFTFNVSTFLDLNGINLITYISFKNIYNSTFCNWKSKENFINLFNVVLYIIKNDNIYLNKNLCVIISDFNIDTNSYNILADPLIINNNLIKSPNELFNLIKWTNNAFNDNLKDIIITIKIL